MRAATLAAAVGGLLAVGCAPRDGAAPRARLEVQRLRLEASLDGLEARLLDGRARVRAWQALRDHQARVAAAGGGVAAGPRRGAVPEVAEAGGAATRWTRLAAARPAAASPAEGLAGGAESTSRSEAAAPGAGGD